MIASTGAASGKMIRKNVWLCVAPSIWALSSRSRGIGVEEALDQPGVGTQRAAEVEEHDRHDRARADRRVRVVELVDHHVDGHERQRRREHLDQQQGEQPGPAALEPQPGEGVGGQRGEEHGAEGDDELTINELKNQFQYG